MIVQPFDLERAEVKGEAMALGIGEAGFDALNLQGRVSASGTGVLASLPPESVGVSGPAWVDRTGKVTLTFNKLATNGMAVLSPDETRVAMAVTNVATGGLDIWVHDLTRDVSSKVTQAAGRYRSPVWSPDGQELAFVGYEDGRGWILRQPANGTGKAERVVEFPSVMGNVHSWTADGRYLVGNHSNPRTGFDLWWLDLKGDRKVRDLMRNEFNETGSRVSPDGRWIAYLSDETKRLEVYVQAFPGLGQKVQVSSAGAYGTCWKHDGSELFFINRSEVMAVKVEGGATLRVSAPRKLFEVDSVAGGCEVARDGRFLVRVPQAPAGRPPMTVILNWPQLLGRR